MSKTLQPRICSGHTPVILAALSPLLLGATPVDTPVYVGGAYTGGVRATVDSSQKSIPMRKYGRASAEFTQSSPGTARLVVFGAIDDDKGDASFAMEGRYDSSGFRASHGGVEFAIDARGEISGGGVIDGHEYRFSGTASRASFDLTVHNQPATGAEPSPIRGITFDYELTRQETAERSKGSSKGCRKIRYEMRPVANIGEGSMSMLRVPVCVN